MSQRLQKNSNKELRFAADDPAVIKNGRKKRLQQRSSAEPLRSSDKSAGAQHQDAVAQHGRAQSQMPVPGQLGKQKTGASAQGTEASPIPGKVTKHRYYDAANGVTTTRLRFAEAKRPARLVFNAAAAPARFTRNKVQDKLREYDGDNSGAAAFHSTEAAGETGVKYVHTKRQKRRDRRTTPKHKVSVFQNKGPSLGSNPLSRRLQRRKIKQGYMRYMARTGQIISGPLGYVQVAARKVTGTAANTVKTLSRKAGKTALLFLGLGGALITLMTALVSCGGMAGSGAGGTAELGAYAAEEADMLAAEAAYCQMEADLQAQIDSYEDDHDYDEYHYELDEIGHDPYVLISLISSIHEGPWTIEDVRPTLDQIFAQQYKLSEVVEEEAVETEAPDPSEPTEPDPTQPPSPRPPGPTPQPQSQEDTPVADDPPPSEPSTRKICTVTLENFNLSRLPVYMLSESQLSHYSVYIASLGCCPELFPDSEYVGRYGTGSYMDYAIPTEALEDEVFAAMMTEARKYLGYPYVWGGSSPSTSFDCSGFVSWVINHCGVGWDYGRRGATPLYYLCTPTSTPHPGDLVFFEKTYETTPDVICTHVGIYVGVNPENGHPMMIHCGDPISFADLSGSYWQEHFYAYGRLPNP